MSYFPSDIPFMSEEELKENRIRIPKGPENVINAYIYKLDLNVENPVVEKFPAQVREGPYGDEVIRWIGPNDYSVWYSEFDMSMLGVVNEPLDNIIELIVRRDESHHPLEVAKNLFDYCDVKSDKFMKKATMYISGLEAVREFRHEILYGTD